MEPSLKAALIGALVTFIGTLIIFYLNRFHRWRGSKKKDQIEKEILTFRERDSESDIDKEFIFSLPYMKAEAYKSCHQNWDTGITLNMGKGNEDLIWFLRFSWLSLARFFPETYFSNKGHSTYIDEYIMQRTNYHYSRLEVGDMQKSGSISRLSLGHAVAKDIDTLVIELVEQVISNDDSRKEEWLKVWNR